MGRSHFRVRYPGAWPRWRPYRVRLTCAEEFQQSDIYLHTAMTTLTYPGQLRATSDGAQIHP
jgi:hypothetical protein